MPSSLSARLATVELQLAMHSCDVTSLLALAQCSKPTLAAASISFAWRHSDQLRVDTSEDESTAAAVVASPLLRHFPLHITWTATKAAGTLKTEGSLPHLLLFCSCNVHLLDTHHIPGSLSTWGALSERSPALMRVTELHMHPFIHSAMIFVPNVLQRMPLLRTLRLYKRCSNFYGDDMALVAVTSLSQLTSLHLQGNWSVKALQAARRLN